MFIDFTCSGGTRGALQLTNSGDVNPNIYKVDYLVC